jgi:hypothetical protein
MFVAEALDPVKPSDFLFINDCTNNEQNQQEGYRTDHNQDQLSFGY